MKDNLENMFKNLENQFNIEEPTIGHYNRFKAKLNNTVTTKKSYKLFSSVAVAASVVLLFGVWLGASFSNKGMELAGISPEMEETQSYFVSVIKMPVTNNIDLSNDYGAINLDKLKGTSKINCDYGKINIGELLNSSNYINIDYTNKSTIEFMKDGEINADYSTLHIEKSGRIKLNADYSHISFGMLANLNYNCDYGDLKIEECGNLSGNSDYMHTTVGILRGSGDFDSDYGSIKINKLGENFKNIKIESSYTSMKFGLNPNNSFNIIASLSYGGLKYDSGFTFSKEITKTTLKQYEGYFKSSNSANNITIKSSYGSVTFTNN